MVRPPSIVVVGEALVDVFPDREVVGGAPFNVARNLAGLGAHVTMVTRVGDDAAGRRVADEYERFGIDRHGLQHDATRATGLVHVALGPDGHRFRIAEDAAWDALDVAAALDAIGRVSPQAVCFGTLAQRASTSREAIVRIVPIVGETGAPRFLDLNLRVGDGDRGSADPSHVVHGSLLLADLVKVNADELAALLAWFVAPLDGAAVAGLHSHGSTARADEQAVARRLVERFALNGLIVTRGTAGCAAYDGLGECVAEAESTAVDAIDTVGAGDAFVAVMLLGRTRGWPMQLTIERATAFAGAVCTLRGAVADDDAFYRVWRARWRLDPSPTASATARTSAA